MDVSYATWIALRKHEDLDPYYLNLDEENNFDSNFIEYISRIREKRNIKEEKKYANTYTTLELIKRQYDLDYYNANHRSLH